MAPDDALAGGLFLCLPTPVDRHLHAVHRGRVADVLNSPVNHPGDGERVERRQITEVRLRGFERWYSPYTGSTSFDVPMTSAPLRSHGASTHFVPSRE